MSFIDAAGHPVQKCAGPKYGVTRWVHAHDEPGMWQRTGPASWSSPEIECLAEHPDQDEIAFEIPD